jgi:hypothetical protein
MCAFIQPPKNFPLPINIAEIIKKKTNNCLLTDLGKDGWILESPTFIIFEGWLRDIYPDPLGSGLYRLIYNFSSGKYLKVYKNMFIVADNAPVEITMPLPFDSAILVDELASRYGLHQVEVILGLLSQMTSALTRNLPDTVKPKSE